MILKRFLRLYSPKYLTTIVYMLQSDEYQPGPYLKWFWRTQDFSVIMHRRTLEKTKPARMLLAALKVGVFIQLLAGIVIILLGLDNKLYGGEAFGIAIILLYPILWAHLVTIPLFAGRWLIIQPREQRRIIESERVFGEHKGTKIAVAGSYGKTTMKELLLTVLSEGKTVAATPANKNVSSSHALFADTLNGHEDILIIEYGEGAPGDIARFARITHPSLAVITGLAAAHLDQYKTIQAAGKDIFSVADYVNHHDVFVNADSKETKPYMQQAFHHFDRHGAIGWRVSDVKTSLAGTTFTMAKGNEELSLKSGLVGSHQVGFLAFAAALALQLGLSHKQVKNGIVATKPFEHRMQPYELSGATIIDDTYNGNLEGIRAGTELLKELQARRKIYVTPGLVDQGDETKRIHLEIGELIAKAKPDIVVLMDNSVVTYIAKGLEAHDFAGELRVEDDPLEFYTNLTHFVAAGDLVVMQNDWPDSYT